jgi:Guanylate kinase
MGKLFVISGPSGAGLREIVGAVLDGRTDIGNVVPVTARKMKAGEQDGVGFWFYDLEGWNAMKESGELLECTEFAGNDYGTSRRLVREQLDKGKNVVLNLETARAAQLKANMPEAVCVYMEPSSEALLRARYEKTARSPFEVSARMDRAAQEKAAAGFCDCTIFTDDAAQAVSELNALIDRG